MEPAKQQAGHVHFKEVGANPLDSFFKHFWKLFACAVLAVACYLGDRALNDLNKQGQFRYLVEGKPLKLNVTLDFNETTDAAALLMKKNTK